MRRRFWWPGQLSDQLMLVQNFRNKIDQYATTLGLTADQVTEAQTICEGFLGALTVTDQAKSDMQSLIEWRDDVFWGSPEGDLVSPAPVFPIVGPVNYLRGSGTLFMDLRDTIVSSKGYTQAIGEALGIVGAEITPQPEDDVAPELKPSAGESYTVQLSGSMKGNTGMRVEYRRKGENGFTTVGFVQNLPQTVQITPAQPGEPESGEIRAVYMRKSQAYGNYSPNYPVTLA